MNKLFLFAVILAQCISIQAAQPPKIGLLSKKQFQTSLSKRPSKIQRFMMQRSEKAALRKINKAMDPIETVLLFSLLVSEHKNSMTSAAFADLNRFFAQSSHKLK